MTAQMDVSNPPPFALPFEAAGSGGADLTLTQLPHELVLEILRYALLVHPDPSSVLCVSSYFYLSAIPLLYSSVWLNSPIQLARFASGVLNKSPLPDFDEPLNGRISSDRAVLGSSSQLPKTGSTPSVSHTRSLRVRLPGVPGGGIRASLYNHHRLHNTASALHLCPRLDTLRLEFFTLRRASYPFGPSEPRFGGELDLCPPEWAAFSRALKSVSPRQFAWGPPDPDLVRGLSLAIVDQVVVDLVPAVKGWKRLERLELSHVQFPHGPARLSSLLVPRSTAAAEAIDGSARAAAAASPSVGAAATHSFAFPNPAALQASEIARFFDGQGDNVVGIGLPDAQTALSLSEHSMEDGKGEEGALDEDERAILQVLDNSGSSALVLALISLPSFRYLHLHSAVSLSSSSLAAIALLSPTIELVEARNSYEGSIWGGRIEVEHVRRAMLRLVQHGLGRRRAFAVGGVQSWDEGQRERWVDERMRVVKCEPE